MTNEFEKEIKDVCRELAKEVSAEVIGSTLNDALMKVENEFRENLKERVTNDIHCQNDYAKQKYPEKSYLSFNLATGNFIVPYDVNSIVTVAFIKDDKKEELKMDTSTYDKFDIAKMLKLCKEYEYCKITCETVSEFELFDEDSLEKENAKIVRLPHKWTQTFEGYARCSDVVAVYQNVAKIEKAEKAEA